MKKILLILTLLISGTIFQSMQIAPTKGAMLGDSILDDWNDYGFQYYAVSSYMLSTMAIDEGHTVTNIALCADTIGGQLHKYTIDANKSNYNWVIIQLGINDCYFYPTKDSSAIITMYQDLIDTIRYYAPACKIIVGQMTPCYRVFSALGADSTAARLRYIAVNRSVAGIGFQPLTDIDIVTTLTYSTFDDGTGRLASQYDRGDGVHTNNKARRMNAFIYRKILNDANIIQEHSNAYFSN